MLYVVLFITGCNLTAPLCKKKFHKLPMQEHLRNLTNHGLAPGTLGLCIIVKNNYLCNIILSLSILNYPF